MMLDDIDIKVLNENFDKEMINKLEEENVAKIYNYLVSNGVYYAKDIFISSLDLFLWPSDEFIEKFEKLKKELGSDYINLLGEDSSLIEIMYS